MKSCIFAKHALKSTFMCHVDPEEALSRFSGTRAGGLELQLRGLDLKLRCLRLSIIKGP